MLHENNLRHFAVNTVILFLLVVTPFILSCGGGGGGGGGDDDDDDSNSAEVLFEDQNSSAINYFSKLEVISDSIFNIEQEIINIEPTDKATQETFIKKVKEDLLPLSGEVSTEWDSILQIEQDLQDILTANAAKSQYLSSGTYKPEAVVTVLISACFAAIAAYSYAETINENYKIYIENLEYCGQELEKLWDSIPSGLSEEQRDQAYENAWSWYLQCTEWAKKTMNIEDLKATLVTLGSTVAPEAIAWEKGKVAIQGASAALDAGNIYILGTNPTINQQSIINFETNNVRDNFISKTDENGEFYAPVGDWKIIAFKEGYIRFGTSDSQQINVLENQTTSVLAEPMLLSQSETFIQNCETDPFNSPPIAESQSLSTQQDTAVQIELHGSDADWDTLTYVVTTQPANGTLSGTAPSLTYTPNSGYYGIDSFTFKVNDGMEDSDEATINITIEEVVEVIQLYVFKLSGVGYHKTYGEAAKVTGYEHQALWLLPSEVDEIVGSDFDNTTACESGPWAGPVLAPAIWESRSMEKIAGPLSSYDDLDLYRCPVPNWVYSNPICNQWVFEYSNDFWNDIASLCGN